MKNKKYKKAQRWLNKLVRDVNRAIEVDNLWLGRFYITQADSLWYDYKDNSGGELIATLVCVDKKDGTLYPWKESFLPGFKLTPGYLSWFMNHFIVEITDVYKNGNNPSNNIEDFREVPRIKFTHKDLQRIKYWYHR